MTKTEELDKLELRHKNKRAELQEIRVYINRFKIRWFLVYISFSALFVLCHYFHAPEMIKHALSGILTPAGFILAGILIFLELNYQQLVQENQLKEEVDLAAFQLSLIDKK